MTTLILNHTRMFVLKPLFLWKRVSGRFLEINARGAITTALLASTGLLLIMYLALLYGMSSLGFDLREKGSVYKELAESKLRLELRLHEREAVLLDEHDQVFSEMERATHIHYLTPENVAASDVLATP